MLKTISVSILIILLQATAIASVFESNSFGVSARSNALGGAYVAVSDATDSTFVNPATIALINDSSMAGLHGTNLDSVNYSVPVSQGVIGMGFIVARTPNTGFPGTMALSSVNSAMITEFTQKVFYLTYATPLQSLVDAFENVYVGANIKFFNQTPVAIGNAASNTAKGIDLDLGVLYRPTGWISFGASQQNALPTKMGGVIVYNNGSEVAMPTVTKAGIRVGLMGDADNYLIESPLYVNLLADTDMYIKNSETPSVTHIGAEVSPFGALSFRAGIDQSYNNTSTNLLKKDNVTCGIGFKMNGIEFNYSMRPYATNSDSRYFSISCKDLKIFEEI